MPKTYDLVAIGTGTAAAVAASRCRAAGWRVAVIDHLPFGGTCALRGCDPKKVLVGVTEAGDYATGLQGKGVVADERAIDWAAVIAQKRPVSEPVPVRMGRTVEEQGIDPYVGRGVFRGRHAGAVGIPRIDRRLALRQVAVAEHLRE